MLLLALHAAWASPQDLLPLVRHADAETLAQALADGVDPAQPGVAEVLIERRDPEIVAMMVERGVRLPEGASVLSWAPDLLRVQLALQLGAVVRREEITFLAQARQHSLLRLLARHDQVLPPSAWSPRRVGPVDPGTAQVLREIVKEERSAGR
jgi:hypothetical protein